MTGPVAATPVVMIDISGQSVRINGTEVGPAGDVDPHQLGVHEAAIRVARQLGRPVRAIATDDTSRTRLVVQLDGTATDMEVIYDAYDVGTDEPVNVVQIVREVAPTPTPATAVGSALVLRREASVASSARTYGRRELRLPQWEVRVPQGTLQFLAGVVVAGLVATIVVLLQRPTTVTATPPIPLPGSAAPSVAAKTPAADPTRHPVERRMAVVAKVRPGIVTLKITATGVPVAAEIVVDGAGTRHRAKRYVKVTRVPQTITISGVPAGRAIWAVRMSGAAEHRGVVKVPATKKGRHR